MTDKPRQQTRTQYAYDQLKAMIMDNSLAAGASFLEQTLAERLGVSRTPLREAAQQLQTEGFVTIRPRLGVLIRPISARDMAEIYDLLTILEPHAARLLAQRDLGPECRAELQGSVFEMDHALRAMDLKAWALADRAFHKQLIDLCGNSRLRDIVSGLWDQVHRARISTLGDRDDLATSNDDHRALLDLIFKGDA
ncbi:MAG: GntR family transcriptional regulator, partial [Pseudomonadota bacterium]